MLEKDSDTVHLITNITHQAVNPLNGVIGTLDNIIDGTTEQHRIMPRLRSARAQLEYATSLIRNLAFFAQYGGEQDGEIVSTSKICVVPQKLIEAAMFFQEQAKRKSIDIYIEDRHIQNAIHGDPDLFEQVFMNIFDNFVKYGESGSRVVAKHWVQKKTGSLIITIEGRATPFDDEEDIFSLGFRGKKAKEQTSSGSGLGLHICRLIISRMFSGTITGQYVNGSRTAKFEVRIPKGFVHESR